MFSYVYQYHISDKFTVGSDDPVPSNRIMEDDTGMEITVCSLRNSSAFAIPVVVVLGPWGGCRSDQIASNHYLNSASPWFPGE